MMAPPEVAGNFTPGWVINSILLTKFTDILPLRKEFNSSEVIFKGFRSDIPAQNLNFT